ncbi:hypothetical protein FWF93_01585 [Candidatus Saccharibacteria bacterium]|nr:hypothetical protein [Candidatus Saccharibacteria bacterium]
MIQVIKNLTTLTKKSQLAKMTREELITLESRIGKQLFGPIPQGRSREFYCLDAHTWVWQEQWRDGDINRKQIVRYEIRPDGIIKNVDGIYKRVEGVELENLRAAMKVYYEEVMRGIYKTDPFTGNKLA